MNTGTFNCHSWFASVPKFSNGENTLAAAHAAVRAAAQAFFCNMVYFNVVFTLAAAHAAVRAAVAAVAAAAHAASHALVAFFFPCTNITMDTNSTCLYGLYLAITQTLFYFIVIGVCILKGGEALFDGAHLLILHRHRYI